MLQVVKYYTNSDSKITHVEISHTVVNGEVSGIASAVLPLRKPLEEYDEASVIKSIAIHSTKINNLIESARTKLEISDLTETVL